MSQMYSIHNILADVFSKRLWEKHVFILLGCILYFINKKEQKLIRLLYYQIFTTDLIANQKQYKKTKQKKKEISMKEMDHFAKSCAGNNHF